jgi:hypothetical protein
MTGVAKDAVIKRKSLDFRFLFAIVAVVEETETAGGSIASLGSPEPPAVTTCGANQLGDWE